MMDQTYGYTGGEMFHTLGSNAGQMPASGEHISLKELISRGEYLRAYELGSTYIQGAADPDLELAGMYALCMSRLGMTDRAISLLEELDLDDADEQAQKAALLGSFYKRKWLDLREREPDAAHKALLASYSNYHRSMELGGDYWCTINAATLALFLGKDELSEELADDVIAECWDRYNRFGTTCDYWVPASLGEAYIIKGQYGTAAKWYESAASHLCDRIGNIKSARLNAAMLVDVLDVAEEEAARILDSIRKPRIVVFAGHRTDRPGRTVPRFPGGITERVKNRLRKVLIGLKPDIGIASAADGSDLLFHECMQEMGKKTHVILPSPVEHFRKVLEKTVPEDWVHRFDRVLDNSSSIEVSSMSRFEHETESVYSLAADYMIEYAEDMRQSIDGDLESLVVWDEIPSEHPGGTGYTVSGLRTMGHEPRRVSIEDLTGRKPVRRTEKEVQEDFPYREIGIYEPTLRPVVVLRFLEEGVSEEKKASELSRVAAFFSDSCEHGSSRILSASCCSDHITILMESFQDAWKFAEDIRESESMTNLSVILHAGLATMLSSSITGRRDYCCREIEEAREVAGRLTFRGQLVTLQFRAMLRHSATTVPETGFLYYGLLRTSDGNRLKLYRIS